MADRSKGDLEQSWIRLLGEARPGVHVLTGADHNLVAESIAAAVDINAINDAATGVWRLTGSLRASCFPSWNLVNGNRTMGLDPEQAVACALLVRRGSDAGVVAQSLFARSDAGLPPIPDGAGTWVCGSPVLFAPELHRAVEQRLVPCLYVPEQTARPLNYSSAILHVRMSRSDTPASHLASLRAQLAVLNTILTSDATAALVPRDCPKDLFIETCSSFLHAAEDRLILKQVLDHARANPGGLLVVTDPGRITRRPDELHVLLERPFLTSLPAHVCECLGVRQESGLCYIGHEVIECLLEQRVALSVAHSFYAASHYTRRRMAQALACSAGPRPRVSTAVARPVLIERYAAFITSACEATMAAIRPPVAAEAPRLVVFARTSDSTSVRRANRGTSVSAQELILTALTSADNAAVFPHVSISECDVEPPSFATIRQLPLGSMLVAQSIERLVRRPAQLRALVGLARAQRVAVAVLNISQSLLTKLPDHLVARALPEAGTGLLYDRMSGALRQSRRYPASARRVPLAFWLLTSGATVAAPHEVEFLDLLAAHEMKLHSSFADAGALGWGVPPAASTPATDAPIAAPGARGLTKAAIRALLEEPGLTIGGQVVFSRAINYACGCERGARPHCAATCLCDCAFCRRANKSVCACVTQPGPADGQSCINDPLCVCNCTHCRPVPQMTDRCTLADAVPTGHRCETEGCAEMSVRRRLCRDCFRAYMRQYNAKRRQALLDQDQPVLYPCKEAGCPNLRPKGTSAGARCQDCFNVYQRPAQRAARAAKRAKSMA
ncbi:uncharacterized protein MONBRDRAFT_23648 [Monosiga brevicollis MX1]|uniref:Uncharacterized protein n=1 Tax=Monosiga brevicollis TaxID=81824 RepID=A9UU24_MONBE|nr:uncharacterized protein MONBRDRAFT_23648 [Monosiga brevicollis MX1]EDQ91348.1 predicted protein [Monosiga brevicollis MX1]|eukprot:XP_001743770.1 hypothetical protein [Monosiga brevicollis MX1]